MSEQPISSTPSTRHWPILAAALALAAACMLPFDVALARQVRTLHGGEVTASSAPSWRKWFDLSEVFGHRYGLALIGATVFALDAGGCRRLPRLLAGAYIGGFACDALKLLIARERPYRSTLAESSLDTFVAWFPLASADVFATPYGREFQSFPSGHAGAACGLAAGLAALYPRGAWWFATLATLALGQRVLAAQHFPSDALLGGAVGILVAYVAHHPRAAGRWFDRCERRASSGERQESSER